MLVTERACTRWRPYDEVMGTALVTGATSGLGEEFCWQLAEAGHDLVLVARTQEKLDDLSNRLEQIANITTEVIAADLSQAGDVQRVAERLDVQPDDESGCAPVGLLVNNAGMGLGEEFLDNELETEEQALDVMVRAVMVLSYHAGRAMRRRGVGAICKISSIAAETGMGTYSAHKAWVKAFSEGLAFELEGTGVTVTAVSPGMTRTNFHKAADVDVSDTPGWIWSDAETVVSQALEAVRRGRVLVTATALYKSANVVSRLTPRWLMRKVMRAVPHM